jgi:large conductance mechanosensitive channel
MTKENNTKNIKKHLKKGNGILNEFKTFALRGNVIDLAVGIVIGAAFTSIVNAFVNDLIMPFIGFITAGTDFNKLYLKLGDATIAYGNFIQTIVNFFVIAVAVFLMVKVINLLRRGKPDDSPEAVEAAAEEKLLTEIRDLLKEQVK